MQADHSQTVAGNQFDPIRRIEALIKRIQNVERVIRRIKTQEQYLSDSLINNFL